MFKVAKAKLQNRMQKFHHSSRILGREYWRSHFNFLMMTPSNRLIGQLSEEVINFL